MKTEYLKRIIVLFSAVFILWNCTDQNEISYELPRQFSVRTSEFLNKFEADSIVRNLQKIISDSVFILEDDDLYSVNIGYFNSAKKAGEKAFYLYSDSVISEYTIYFGDSAKVYDEYRYIPYLGEDLNRPAIVKYDLLKKKSKLIWSRWGRKIINFSYPRNFSPAYFLTALTFGREAGFPYITEVRVYKYNIADDVVNRLDILGKGLQVFTDYDNNWNYTVYFNILDSAHTSSIIQIENTYNSNARKIESSERSYSILDEGYPIPNLSLPKLVSESKNYYLKAEASDSTISYYLNNYLQNRRDFVLSTKMELGKIEWAPAEDYLAMSLKDISNKDSSELLIINTNRALVEKEFQNKGALNFIVHGDLLIFDDWNHDDSRINIYNYRTKIPYDTLTVPGGCGLNFIKSEYIGY